MRGTVILFEADNFGFGKIFFEFENVANVGAAPGINRLVFIADRADVVPLTGKHAHEFVLRTVRILIFVDEKILEATIVVFAHRRRGLQQAHRFEQQIVKIQRVRLAQLFAILLEQVGDALGLGIGGLQVKFLGIEHVILGPGDAAENRARGELLVVDAEALHYSFDHGLLVALVIDDEIFRVPDGRLPGNTRGNAHSFNVAPQHAHAEGMESRDDGLGDAETAHELFHALTHFGGGFVGEGHG